MLAHIMLNRVTDGSSAFADDALARVQLPANRFIGVPKSRQYRVRFQPITDNQFLHVTR